MLAHESPKTISLQGISLIDATWTKNNIPANTSDIISIHVSKNNSLLLATKKQIWQNLADGTWNVVASSPNAGNISQYLIGETVAYVIVNALAYQMHLESGQWKAIPNSSFVDLATIDGDTLWGINEAGYLHRYTPGSIWVKTEISPLKFWNPYQSVGIAAKGDNFWFGLKYRAKQLFEQDKQAVARETVWQVNKDQQIDITENLSLLNLSGKPFGAFGQVCMTPDGNLYASTEQGIWQRSINNLDNKPGWEQLRTQQGNNGLFPLGNSSLLTYNSRSQELLWWYNQTWYSIPTPSHQISSVALIGNTLYIANSNTVSSISLETATSLEPPKPKMATYLNLGKLSSAIYCQNQLFVTNENTLFKIDASNPEPISLSPLNTATLDISNSGESIWIATKAKLLRYNITQNALTSVFSNATAPKVARVDSDSSGNLTAYLADKVIRIFDHNSNTLLTQITIKADYIEDIAIKNNQLYVVGYNNQRNAKQKLPVQSAFLKCFQISNILTELWQTWGFSGNQLGNDMADTRMYRVVATDGEVVVLGESAGGNTAYRWNGKDLSTPTLVKYDMFNDAFDSQSAHFCYYGIIDAATGTIKRGQFSIPRLYPTSMRSNTNKVRSLAYHESSIYVGSLAFSQISDRNFTKFLGKKPPVYKDGDAALLKVPNNLAVRNFWFTPGNGQVLFFDGNCAVINVAAGTPQNPLLNGKSRLSGEDAYIVIW